MAPRGTALASCGDDKILRRRSSVMLHTAQVLTAINERFTEVDQNGDGRLQKEELMAFVNALAPLQDPKNDADAICAAIDTDSDGVVSREEFTNFCMGSLMQFEEAGKDLDVEEIIRSAFRAVIASAKRERDLIIESFMSTSHEMPKDLTTSSKWLHEAFDDFYQAPTESSSAPIYQTKRKAFLKEALTKTIIECDNPRCKKPSLDCKSFDNAPDRQTFKQFCSNWLKKISTMEAPQASSPLQALKASSPLKALIKSPQRARRGVPTGTAA